MLLVMFFFLTSLFLTSLLLSFFSPPAILPLPSISLTPFLLTFLPTHQTFSLSSLLFISPPPLFLTYLLYHHSSSFLHFFSLPSLYLASLPIPLFLSPILPSSFTFSILFLHYSFPSSTQKETDEKNQYQKGSETRKHANISLSFTSSLYGFLFTSPLPSYCSPILSPPFG